jgi:CheY-like chemotaxis protein
VIVAQDVAVVGELRARMGKAGYRPISAADVAEAIAAITHEKPALVLVDVVEPGVHGWDLVAKLDRSPALARIPRVVLGRGGQPPTRPS